jgi:peptide chain release factor 1
VVSFLLTTKIAIFAHSKITMLDKLEAIKARFDQVGVALTNPEIINNQSEFGKYSKEYRSLEKIVIPYERYVKVLAEHKFAKDALNGNAYTRG